MHSCVDRYVCPLNSHFMNWLRKIFNLAGIIFVTCFNAKSSTVKRSVWNCRGYPILFIPLVHRTGTMHSTWLHACVRVSKISRVNVFSTDFTLGCAQWVCGAWFDKWTDLFETWFTVCHPLKKSCQSRVRQVSHSETIQSNPSSTVSTYARGPSTLTLKPTGVLLFLKCGRFPCERKETWSFGATQS